MNNIKLKRVNIKNFKGVATLNADFEDKLTQIKGPSGSSKTTILDAIKWCMGYPVSNWEPTKSINRVKISGIVTSVEVSFEINGSLFVIQKNAEQKIKTSNETGATLDAGYEYTYSFDGLDCKASTFKEKIVELFGIDYKKLLYILDTNIFLDDNQTNWTERRKWLYELLDIDNKTSSISDKSEYNLIAEDLKKGKTEIDIQKMLNAEKKGIADDLVRNKTLIDSKVSEMGEYANIDFDHIEKHKTELSIEIETLQSETKQGQTNSLLEEKQSELNAIRTKLNNVKSKISNQEFEHNKNKNELGVKIRDKKSDLEFCNEKIIKLTDDIEDLKIELENLRSQEFGSQDLICPTCKQGLPKADIIKMVADFEDKKSKDISSNELEAQNKAVEKQNAQDRANTLTEQLNVLEGELSALNEVVIDKSEIDTLEKELFDKQTEINNLPKTDIDNTIQEKITTLKTEYENCIRELVKKDQLAKIKEEIQRLKDNSKKLAEKDSERIAKQKQLDSYIEEKVSLVSTEINSHFEGVNWQLFTTNSDMAENKYNQACFAFIKGNSGNSTGERLFVALKVNEGLQNLLGVNMFIFIDEKQSSTLDYITDRQIIELITTTENPNFTKVSIKDVFGE